MDFSKPLLELSVAPPVAVILQSIISFIISDTLHWWIHGARKEHEENHATNLNFEHHFNPLKCRQNAVPSLIERENYTKFEMQLVLFKTSANPQWRSSFCRKKIKEMDRT